MIPSITPKEDRSTPSRTKGIGAVGLALLVLLIAAAILSYLDRLAISTLGPLLKARFSLDNLHWGYINSAFSLVYIFTSLLGGWWVDRAGVRKGLLISIAIWGLAAMGHSLARGFWSLCFWRMMLALGEGPGMAAMVKGTRRLMPPRWRDFGNGLMNAGWAVGALISPLVVDPISRHFGWQAAFLTTGGLCVLWIPLWALFSWGRSKILGPQEIAFVVGSDQTPPRLDFRSLGLWATIAGLFCTVPPTVFVNTFLPVFFHDARHLSQEQYARLYWQPFLAADLGQVIGGLLVYLLLRMSWKYLIARRTVMFLGFVGAVVLIHVNHEPGVRGTMWCINISRFFFQVGYTALVAYGIESVAERQTALMAGLMNATFSACNLVFNPLIGWMADSFGHFNEVIVMISLMPVIGLIAWMMLSTRHARQTVSPVIIPIEEVA